MADDTDYGLQQFDLARKRAAAENTAAVQGQKDALKRRFAAAGSLNSGIAAKQDQLVDEAGQQNLQKANEGIDANLNTELARRKEVADQRNFAKSEREASQGFAAGQADLARGFQSSEADKQRQYGTSERLGGQNFASSQADLARKYGTTEREAGQNFSAYQAGLARDLQNNQFLSSLDLSNRQFGEEQRVNTANIGIANDLLNKKDLLEKLLDPKSLLPGSFSGLPGTSFGLPGLPSGLPKFGGGGGRSFFG